MASKVLTIALGTDTAKLSEVQLSGKKVIVFNAYDVEFSDGLCDDGIIIDTEGLAEELKEFIRSKGIKSKRIVYSIASKRIASKEVVIPFVKANKIGSIVKVNAGEYFPISNLEDYSINYSILEEIKAEDKKQYRLSVTATPNELLQKYYELTDLLRMSIETIDYSGNSILQVLQMQTHDETNAILQLGRENTVINIMNGKVLVMQRSVSYGLDAILSAVKDGLHLDDEDAFAFIEDNEISRICSAYSDVEEVVSIIVSGISRVFEFYGTRNSDNPITGIKFIGDGTSVNGVGELIETSFGYPTEEILTLKNVDVKKRFVSPEQATNFMANIGAVLAPMNIEFISLEESEKRAKAESKPPYWLLVLSAFAAVLLAVGSIIMVKNSTKEKVELEQQLTSLKDMQSIEDQINDAQAKNKVVQDFLDSTKGPNDSLLRLIMDLEKIMPTGMSIDSFNLESGKVTLNMGGNGKDSVSKLIYELKNLKYVENVHIDFVSETFQEFSKYDSFTVTFDILDVNGLEAGEDLPDNLPNEIDSIENITDSEENIGGDE